MNFASARRALPAMAAGVLLTVLPLLSQARAGGGGPVPLRMKYKQGEINKYQTNMAITIAGMGGPKGAQGGGMPIQQLSVMQQFKTNKLLPNGSAEVIVTTVNMQGGAGMGNTSLPKPVTLVMDSRGVVKATKGAATGMMGGMLGSNALGTQQVPLPEKAVKPGDTWSNPLPMPGMGTGSIKGQFIKLETVGKHQTALLHYVLTMPVKIMMDSAMQPTQSAAAANMTMSGNVVMNIDNDVELQAGRLIRSSGAGTMLMTIASKTMPRQLPPKPGAPAKPPAPGNMKMNTNITLGTTLVE
ncbi:MAG: hypothetical protein JWL77_3776 [Chthonomonadaceae bacterium]|nr:hypothetical protein [Chthonomonadaceae bacterium]